MKTAMQELKSDLLTAIHTCNEALEEIKDLQTRNACQTVVNLTIDNILNRIDTELLEMEKEHIIIAEMETLRVIEKYGISSIEPLINELKQKLKTFKSE